MEVVNNVSKYSSYAAVERCLPAAVDGSSLAAQRRSLPGGPRAGGPPAPAETAYLHTTLSSETDAITENRRDRGGRAITHCRLLHRLIYPATGDAFEGRANGPHHTGDQAMEGTTAFQGAGGTSGSRSRKASLLGS